MSPFLDIISVIIAVFIGYALGVRHTKRAMYAAMDQFRYKFLKDGETKRDE